MPKGGNANPTEYTLADVQHDLKQMVKIAKSFASRFDAVEKRMDTLESTAQNVNDGAEDDPFGAGDRKKALSVLADRVINPDDHMLPQMTETPDRMLMPMIIKHAQNEFLKQKLENPASKVLFSDLLMKWCDIKMRSRHRALIGEAMGFSQIEVDKAIDEEARGLESRGEG